MRSRLLILVLAAAVLALPAAAPAKLTVGISENSPGMFSHPLFAGLGAKHARVVMAYNVMTSGNHELARVTAQGPQGVPRGQEAELTSERSCSRSVRSSGIRERLERDPVIRLA
jgi:hypothetical protein